MTEIEIGLRAVVGDEALAVLSRAHRARINVEIGVELSKPNLVTPSLKARSKGRRRKPFSERRHHAAGDEYVPRHGHKPYACGRRFGHPYYCVSNRKSARRSREQARGILMRRKHCSHEQGDRGHCLVRGRQFPNEDPALLRGGNLGAAGRSRRFGGRSPCCRRSDGWRGGSFRPERYSPAPLPTAAGSPASANQGARDCRPRPAPKTARRREPARSPDRGSRRAARHAGQGWSARWM